MIFRWPGKESQEENEWREWYAWRPVYTLDEEGYHTIFWLIRIERLYSMRISGLTGATYRSWKYRSIQ